MSKRDVVNAYLEGRITRRQFIKRLIGLGVSIVAAGTYAQALAPNADAQPFVTSSGVPLEYPPEYPPEGTQTDANNISRGGPSGGGGISQDIEQDSSSGDINQSFRIS